MLPFTLPLVRPTPAPGHTLFIQGGSSLFGQKKGRSMTSGNNRTNKVFHVNFGNLTENDDNSCSQFTYSKTFISEKSFFSSTVTITRCLIIPLILTLVERRKVTMEEEIIELQRTKGEIVSCPCTCCAFDNKEEKSLERKRKEDRSNNKKERRQNKEYSKDKTRI